MKFQKPMLIDRVLCALERVEYRLALADPERAQIFTLRYGAYLRAQAIEPNGAGKMMDDDDDAENVWIVGLYYDGELASSIRFHVAASDKDYLPTAQVFPELLMPKLAAGSVIIDPTRFVADHEMSRRVPELPYLTLRIPWMAMEHFAADLMLAAVRLEHEPFYRRLWGNTLLAQPRQYPGLRKPVCLTALDYRQSQASIEQRYPFFRSTIEERRATFSPQLRSAVMYRTRNPAANASTSQMSTDRL